MGGRGRGRDKDRDRGRGRLFLGPLIVGGLVVGVRVGVGVLARCFGAVLMRGLEELVLALPR